MFRKLLLANAAITATQKLTTTTGSLSTTSHILRSVTSQAHFSTSASNPTPHKTWNAEKYNLGRQKAELEHQQTRLARTLINEFLGVKCFFMRTEEVRWQVSFSERSKKDLHKDTALLQHVGLSVTAHEDNNDKTALHTIKISNSPQEIINKLTVHLEERKAFEACKREIFEVETLIEHYLDIKCSLKYRSDGKLMIEYAPGNTRLAEHLHEDTVLLREAGLFVLQHESAHVDGDHKECSHHVIEVNNTLEEIIKKLSNHEHTASAKQRMNQTSQMHRSHRPSPELDDCQDEHGYRAGGRGRP